MAKKFFFLSFYNLFFFFLNFLFFSFLFFSFPGIIPLHFHIATILTTKFLKVPLRFLVSFSYWHCLFLFPSNCHNNDMYPSRIIIDVYFFVCLCFPFIYVFFFWFIFWSEKGIEKKGRTSGIRWHTSLHHTHSGSSGYWNIKLSHNKAGERKLMLFVYFVCGTRLPWSLLVPIYCRHFFPFHFLFYFFIFYFFISFHLDCPSYFNMWKPRCYY